MPVRLRTDKIYPNSLTTANNNWNSIQHPVTEDMLKAAAMTSVIAATATATATSTATATVKATEKKKRKASEGQEPNPAQELAQAPYYTSQPIKRGGLNKFHNFVKSHIIGRACELLRSGSSQKRNISLIDLAVGRGGDLCKWQEQRINEVFGIDKDSANILDAKDRFRNIKKECKLKADEDVTMQVQFIVGNTNRSIRTGEAFGRDSPDKTDGKEFDITSIQFAIHYMFKDSKFFDGFINNVQDVTASDGYFIGTCFNGRRLHEFLQKQPNGIWQSKDETILLQRKYDGNPYEGGPLMGANIKLGQAVGVKFPSFNEMHDEYLVDLSRLKESMEQKGFELIDQGSFATLAPLTKTQVKDDEKLISDLNDYFIYKKKAVTANVGKSAKRLRTSGQPETPPEAELPTQIAKVTLGEELAVPKKKKRGSKQ